MAKAKNHYYILVITNGGPVFVTGIGEHHTAMWDKGEKPKEFSKAYAEDIVLGLNLNMHQAFLVTHKWEIESHPYRYGSGHFDWTWDK